MNELAEEYGLPPVEGADVALIFLGNRIWDAWRVVITPENGPRSSATAATPRIAYGYALLNR